MQFNYTIYYYYLVIILVLFDMSSVFDRQERPNIIYSKISSYTAVSDKNYKRITKSKLFQHGLQNVPTSDLISISV